jgi:hypothetical protein
MPLAARAAGSICLFVLTASCSAGSGEAGNQRRPSAQTGGTTGSGGELNVGVGAAVGAGGGIGIGGSGDAGGSAGVEACATESARATLTSDPIDILMVLDNSGSMAEEMEAAEANINQNFARILDSAGVDYRVILLSRHRREARTASEEASTSICVATPLSGLAACPAPLPVFSEKFFQYGEKVESFDGLDRLISSYSAPDTKTKLSPNGYQEWLRPEAKKAVIMMTDDDESGGGSPLTAQAFLEQFTALSNEHFGTADAPSFRFHSIIGIAEKNPPTAPYTPDEPINQNECTGNGADIESYGPTYQELSIRTGGLRFPLCQFPGYDAVFQSIADDVIVQAVLACDFPIPEPPPGKTLELEKVAVRHTRADQTELFLKQAPSSADCQAGTFYIEAGRVWLCPAACDAIKAENGANVDVLFTCENQIVVL